MEREVKTVMHELKFRTLTIKETKMLGLNMKQVVFTGDDLKDFVSDSPDDHLKLFFPYPDEEVAKAPSFTASEGKNVSGRLPIMRDYTPRSYDPETNELRVDFFLHQNGVGTDWVRSVVVGSRLLVAGPRASRVVPYSFDGYLLVGDESFLPSVARRLEELPREAKTEVILVVASIKNIVELPEKPSLNVRWVFHESAGKEEFVHAVRKFRKPAGDWYTWVGCEKESAFAVKEILLKEYDFKEEWISAKAYWQR